MSDNYMCKNILSIKNMNNSCNIEKGFSYKTTMTMSSEISSIRNCNEISGTILDFIQAKKLALYDGDMPSEFEDNFQSSNRSYETYKTTSSYDNESPIIKYKEHEFEISDFKLN